MEHSCSYKFKMCRLDEKKVTDKMPMVLAPRPRPRPRPKLQLRVVSKVVHLYPLARAQGSQAVPLKLAMAKFIHAILLAAVSVVNLP